MNNSAPKRFYQLTLKDPLFAAEGMDLDNAQLAVDELEKQTLELEKVWRSSHRWFCFRYPFADTLHPVRFLRTFVACERQRRRFMTTVSQPDAAALIKAYLRCVNALDKDLRAYRDALLGIQKLEKFPLDATIQYFDHMISFEGVLKIIDAMLGNAAMLREDIERRSALLAGRVDMDVFSIPAPPQSLEEVMPIKFEHRPLSPELRKILETKLSYKLIIEKYGPLFYNSDLFDREPTVHEFHLAIIKDSASERRKIAVFLADQYYFLDLNEMKDKFFLGMSIYEPLIRRGIPYWNQPATAFYSVFDLEYYADLTTAADLKWRRPFLDQAAVLRQKSSMFDLLLFTGADYDGGYTTLSKVMARANELPSLIFTYIARGYPSLYYLPFNRSVWRRKEKLRFWGSRFGEGSPYKRFEEIYSRTSPDMMEQILKGGSYRRKDWQNLK